MDRPSGREDEGSGPGRRVLVADACVLINLLKLDRLDLFTSSGLRPTTTRLVLSEVTEPSQEKALEGAVSSGSIEAVDSDSDQAVEVYLDLVDGGLGKGEASCLALCSITAETVLACDERGRCFRRAVARLGLDRRLVSTRDLINLAVKKETLSPEEADTLLADLRTRHRFDCEALAPDEPLPPALT